mgnify:CR=1 FL=1
MMEKMMKLVKDESGQGMAEYGLILAGVAVAAMVALFLLGPTISNLFTNVNTQLTP